MDFPCEVETGLQLLERLSSRPSLSSVYPNLFGTGPNISSVIEISYDINTHYSTILCEIISNALLPESYGGKNAGVIILLTDGHFDLIHLVATLNQLIKQRNFCQLDLEHETDSLTNSVVEKCLDNLKIMHVHDSTQLLITIQNIEDILSSDQSISLVVVDTLSSFYWADRIANPLVIKMDTYLKNILKALQAATREYRSVIMYTKPSYFVSKSSVAINASELCVQEPTLEKVNYRLSLSASELNTSDDTEQTVKVNIANSQCVVTKNFKLNDLLIQWV